VAAAELSWATCGVVAERAPERGEKEKKKERVRKGKKQLRNSQAGREILSVCAT
jgi:hypothetical protein